VGLRTRQFQNIDNDGCNGIPTQNIGAGAQFQLFKLKKEFMPRHNHTLRPKQIDDR
jgi:hypothetical protein